MTCPFLAALGLVTLIGYSFEFTEDSSVSRTVSLQTTPEKTCRKEEAVVSSSSNSPRNGGLPITTASSTSPTSTKSSANSPKTAAAELDETRTSSELTLANKTCPKRRKNVGSKEWDVKSKKPRKDKSEEARPDSLCPVIHEKVVDKEDLAKTKNSPSPSKVADKPRNQLKEQGTVDLTKPDVSSLGLILERASRCQVTLDRCLTLNNLQRLRQPSLNLDPLTPSPPLGSTKAFVELDGSLTWIPPSPTSGEEHPPSPLYPSKSDSEEGDEPCIQPLKRLRQRLLSSSSSEKDQEHQPDHQHSSSFSQIDDEIVIVRDDYISQVQSQSEVTVKKEPLDEDGVGEDSFEESDEDMDQRILVSSIKDSEGDIEDELDSSQRPLLAKILASQSDEIDPTRCDTDLQEKSVTEKKCDSDEETEPASLSILDAITDNEDELIQYVERDKTEHGVKTRAEFRSEPDLASDVGDEKPEPQREKKKRWTPSSHGNLPSTHRGVSYLDELRAPNKVKIIEALPMPAKRGSAKKQDAVQEAGPSKSESIPAVNFYAKTEKEEARRLEFKRPSNSPEERKALRLQKLKKIAEGQSALAASVAKPLPEKSKYPVKIKQSSAPKAHIFAQVDTIRPTDSARFKGGPKATHLASSTTHTFPPRNGEQRMGDKEIEAQTSVASKNKVSSSHGIRRKAETTKDEYGNKMIKKLSFSNVLANVGSQDLSGVAPVALPKPLCLPHVRKDSTAQHDIGMAPELKKRVRFKLDSQGKPYVKVHPIENLNKGKKVADASGFEKAGASNEDTKKLRAISMGRSGLNYGEMLKRILRWSTKWLEEQERIKQAPPVLGDNMTLSHVPPVFEGYSDYCQTFYPLMLYEIWSKVFQDFSECNRHRCPPLLFALQHAWFVNQFQGLKLSALLTADEKSREAYLPVEGYLMNLKLMCAGETKDQPLTARSIFAFVINSKIQPRPRVMDDGQLKMLETLSISNRRHTHILTVEVLVRHLTPKFVVITDRPHEGVAVARIKPM
jgi:hypothetical protein